MSKKVNKQQGFTLIELLLVLAVISVMMVVAISMAQNKSRDMKSTAVIQQFLAIENAALAYYNLSQTPTATVWPSDISLLTSTHLLSSLDLNNPWSGAFQVAVAQNTTTNPGLLIFTTLPDYAIPPKDQNNTFLKTLMNQIPYAYDTTSPTTITNISNIYGVNLPANSLAAVLLPPGYASSGASAPLLLNVGLINPGTTIPGPPGDIPGDPNIYGTYLQICQKKLPYLQNPIITVAVTPTRVSGSGSVGGAPGIGVNDPSVYNYAIHGFNAIVSRSAGGWMVHLAMQTDPGVTASGYQLQGWESQQQIMFMVFCTTGNGTGYNNDPSNSRWPNN